MNESGGFSTIFFELLVGQSPDSRAKLKLRGHSVARILDSEQTESSQHSGKTRRNITWI